MIRRPGQLNRLVRGLAVMVVKKDCDVAGSGSLQLARQFGRYHGDDSVIGKVRFFAHELSTVYSGRAIKASRGRIRRFRT